MVLRRQVTAHPLWIDRVPLLLVGQRISVPDSPQRTLTSTLLKLYERKHNPMVKKYRDLTEKYRTFRLQPDPTYLSRTIQTLFNKFIKKGKKGTSRRHLARALQQFRFTLKRPRLFNTLTRVLRSLWMQLVLVSRRQANQILEVPTPLYRNKREVLSLQTFYDAVQKRTERTLYERLEQELLALTFYQSQSSTLRQRNLYMSRVYEQRVYVDKRWK